MRERREFSEKKSHPVNDETHHKSVPFSCLVYIEKDSSYAKGAKRHHQIQQHDQNNNLHQMNENEINASDQY